jgi:phospholipase/lecithinase/hemolysin
MSHTPRPLTRQHRSATWILAGCLAILLVPTTPAAAQGGEPPLVVFGDSLSDSGNAFAFVHQNATPPDFGLDSLLVPSAPYAVGGHHFTNGDTWIEQLASRFGVGRYTLPAFASVNPNAMNFAVATARARDDGTCGANPTPACQPSLALLIASFLQKTGGVAPPGALYVIQIGGNDLRDALRLAFAEPPNSAGAEAILNAALQSIAQGIATLHAAGARHFLVWNVPNQAVTPAARLLNLRIPRDPDFQSVAAFATGLFNYGLSHEPVPLVDPTLGLLQVMRATFQDSKIRLFDADAVLTAFFLFPNRYGFTNVTDACVTPGTVPFTCRTPDQYLFWDGIHPTTAAHGKIAIAVAELFVRP